MAYTEARMKPSNSFSMSRCKKAFSSATAALPPSASNSSSSSAVNASALFLLSACNTPMHAPSTSIMGAVRMLVVR